ncbi:hypothetical protein F5Y12DRAFT_784307 [Xylaria sp. FL1777]|nr:hypothetical protein F5Y12DRAFT_784307 [Xylaria sp. FL1777]
MPKFTLMQARQTGISIYNLFNRSGSAAIALSSGAIIAVTVAGSVFIFLLIVGPLLVYRAKRQDRDRAALCPVSNLSFAEHGQFVDDGDINGPRRLRKKSAASEGVAYASMKSAESIGGGERGEPMKHLSLPNLPSVFSRPGSWRISGPFSSNRPWDNGTDDDSNGNTSGNGTASRVQGEQMYGSPEKHRGYIINQNRRKTSWIDEDALHGPRVSPKKNSKRKSSWFPGNELTRTLSRHLSFRRFGAPELARSPTLPFIETSQEQNQKSRKTENEHTLREPGAELGAQAELRFPVRQPLQQGGSLNSQPRAQRLSTALPTEQLAGRARVPSFDQSNTDAELQAILRRTAERLDDGSQSARRQTLMLPTSSTPSRWPDHTRRDHDQECGCGKDHKSAPAAVSYSELEGCSPRIQQDASQNSAPWQTHRRTHHTRHISQISQLSMLSQPENAASTPSRCSTQVDIPHNLLPSPNRMTQTSFSYPQQVSSTQTYSPASEKSSALSTVYSEDERSSPNTTLQDKIAPDGGHEMERRAMAQALRACDAFDGGQAQRDGDPQGNIQNNHDPRPLHIRRRTLERALPSTSPIAALSASTPKDGIMQPGAGTSPKVTLASTPQSVKAKQEDPFTAYTTPKRHTPQRLSQVFSPLPAELPGHSTSSPVKESQPISETPTPSPSRKQLIPPPCRLRPMTSSPTLGHYHDPEFQIQPPSREPSPAVSESGLSSVYESYRYSRYSDSLEGSQALARLSAATMLTVPPAEASPPERWDEDIGPATSAENRKSYCGIENGVGTLRSTNASLKSGTLGVGAYTHYVGTLKPSTAEDGCAKMGYSAAASLPHAQQSRQISLSNVSDMSAGSAYSQDEDGQDRLGPLMPFIPATTASGKHGMRVTSAVAELRRMNSQVSCVSGYSTATTNVAGDVSPTLPALRGGGCSPGKKGVGGGTKNYLSLGSSPTRGGGEGEDSNAESKRNDVSSGRNGNGQSEKTMVPVGLKDTVTLRRGGRGRPRGNTVVERFEQDLDRARQALRESQGYSLQAIPEVSTKSGSPRKPRTHAAKLSQEEGRMSPMGLGLYDSKGFLRSSLTSDDLTERV